MQLSSTQASKSANELANVLAQVPLTTDFRSFLSLCRRRRKIDDGGAEGARRIAVLGGATTDFLKEPLSLELEARGVRTTIHASDYNTYAHEMLCPDSSTVSFKPDVAVVLTTPFNISDWPASFEASDDVTARAAAVAEQWLSLCRNLHSLANCDIVLSNFHPLPEQPLGNLGGRVAWDRNTFVRKLNDALFKAAPDYVQIFDIERLATTYGTANWFDARYWHHAKQPVAFDCLVPFVRSLAAVIAAGLGLTAKCLVVDLDNTLWGGVIGDDGLEGILIGQGSAEGEAFQSFQTYLKRLQERGVLLAVASKNEPEIAWEVFERHPEIILSADDFVAFKAGWNPKTESIEQIANELNLGLDAIVFVDDNPAERSLVRQSLPQVRVVELSADPADYAASVDRTGWFEIVRLTDEDRRKSEQYKANVERDQLAATSTDYSAYLRSLHQKAIIRPFEPVDIDRITQLINKTNQFNVTTRRRTRSEVESLLSRDDALTLSVRVADCFGDNGLISVLIAFQEGPTLNIDTWLMSCRVLKRGVEQTVSNALFQKASERGIDTVTGLFIPTTKNKLVAQLYADLGFENKSTGNDGETSWQLEVQNYVPHPVEIEIFEDFK